MAHSLTGNAGTLPNVARPGYRVMSTPARQEYEFLYIAFIAAPLLAGIDKFLHLLTNWEMYLAPFIARRLPVSGHTFMMAAGVVEIVAGILVAIKPRIGAYVVAAWLIAIILNLLLAGTFFDIALRDAGLALGAIALGRLSDEYGS